MLTWDEIRDLKPTQYVYEALVSEWPGCEPRGAIAGMVVAAGENGLVLARANAYNVVTYDRRFDSANCTGRDPVGGIPELYATEAAAAEGGRRIVAENEEALAKMREREAKARERA